MLFRGGQLIRGIIKRLSDCNWLNSLIQIDPEQDVNVALLLFCSSAIRNFQENQDRLKQNAAFSSETVIHVSYTET
jgi:hypothetical protein